MSFDFSSLKAFVSSLLGIINGLIVPLLVTVGVVFFVWNLTLFVIRSDNESERAKAKSYMLWSIIAFFLIFSIWGIIAVLRNTVGITNPIPQFKEQGTSTTTVVLPPIANQPSTPAPTTSTNSSIVNTSLPALPQNTTVQPTANQIIFPGGKQ